MGSKVTTRYFPQIREIATLSPTAVGDVVLLQVKDFPCLCVRCGGVRITSGGGETPDVSVGRFHSARVNKFDLNVGWGERKVDGYIFIIRG